jgi:hypothetical protein
MWRDILLRTLSLAAIGGSYLLYNTAENQLAAIKARKEAYAEFQRKGTAFYEEQKALVDQINKNVEKYKKFYKLEPGTPLPPDTFTSENSIWKDFQGKEPMIFPKSHTFKKGESGLTLTCAISIGNTVPQENESYAHCCIIWPFEIFGSPGAFYPPNKNAFLKVQAAYQKLNP